MDIKQAYRQFCSLSLSLYFSSVLSTYSKMVQNPREMKGINSDYVGDCHIYAVCDCIWRLEICMPADHSNAKYAYADVFYTVWQPSTLFTRCFCLMFFHLSHLYAVTSVHKHNRRIHIQNNNLSKNTQMFIFQQEIKTETMATTAKRRERERRRRRRSIWMPSTTKM